MNDSTQAMDSPERSSRAPGLAQALAELRTNERLRRESEIAREIQSSLLPRSLPENPSLDVFAGCIPAHRVGGDYYDFFAEESGRLGMLVADVAGHSIASGLIAMRFRSSFREHREHDLEMSTLFRRVNRLVHSELRMTGHFLSAVYASYEPASGRLRYVNAGHNPPLIARGDGEFRKLDESGLLLGVLSDWDYVSGEEQLASGDTLILYTDGVVEAANQHEELFGLDRLQHAITKYRHRSSKELYHYVLKEIYRFQDEDYTRDDVTLVVLKVR